MIIGLLVGFTVGVLVTIVGAVVLVIWHYESCTR